MSTHKHYLLALLTVILAFNYTDRFALGMVMQDIKVDLSLSDSELGLLSGIAFALFYSVMGIPIGRWADRGNRVTIVGLSTALWSAAVALCGVASGFSQLMLIRVVVGVGEAGCVPPAHSLIADFFTRTERPRAVGIYMQGISLSLVIGYFAAGWLDQRYGWRLMFVMIGLPGLALAALAWLTLNDPRRAQANRGASRPAAGSMGTQASLRKVCLTLWATRTFRHLLYAFSGIAFCCYGCLQWMPAFFIRSFALKPGDLGTWFAAMVGGGAVLGTYCGGAWAGRYAARNEGLQLRATAVTLSLAGMLMSCVYFTPLAPSHYIAFAWLGLGILAAQTINAPVFAVIQTLVPERMRAMAIALIYFASNLIGLGFGPWATGALSDALRPWAGEESLRYALLLMSPGFLWGAWHLWAASRTVSQEIDANRAAGLAEPLVASEFLA